MSEKPFENEKSPIERGCVDTIGYVFKGYEQQKTELLKEIEYLRGVVDEQHQIINQLAERPENEQQK